MGRKLLIFFMISAFAACGYAESLTNLQAIAQELDKRKIELDKREKELTLKDERMKALEDELVRKESELRKLKTTISERLNEIKTIEDENLDKLAQIYGSAKAKSAAEIIAKMDLNKAVQLIKRLSAMPAGKIMTAMGKSDPVFAAKISEKLTPDGIVGVDGE